MRLIKLQIQKKTLVPTKRQLVHMYRSDWKTKGYVEYNQSPVFFRALGQSGMFESDAQFAFWLKNTFGTGIYSVKAWQMKTQGFYGFFKVNCKETSFLRLPRTETREKKEIRDLMAETRRLKKQIKDAGEDADAKRELQEEINSLSEDRDLTKEIEAAGKNRYGPSPYLKSMLPVYKEHDYEPYGRGIISKVNQQTFSDKEKRIKRKESKENIMEENKEKINKVDEDYNQIW